MLKNPCWNRICPAPLQAGARLDRCGAFRTGSLAVVAGFPSRNFKFGLFSVDGFFEGQFQIVLKVVTAFRSIATSLAPKKIFEDVVEGIAEAASSKAETIRTALLSPGVAEHVVALAFVLVAQRLVSLVDFFELFFRRFFLGLSGLEIGMVLAGHLPIGLLELVVGRGSFDA